METEKMMRSREVLFSSVGKDKVEDEVVEDVVVFSVAKSIMNPEAV